MTKQIHGGRRSHRRRRPGGHPVHAQYQNHGCGGQPCSRSRAACRRRVPDRPAGSAGHGSRPELCGHLQGRLPLPLVADIHFDYRLAIAAAEGGAAKIRINPGNIGGEDRVRGRGGGVPRPGISPSASASTAAALSKRLLEKYGHPTAGGAGGKRLSAHPELLEKQGFYDICVSMKSSNVPHHDAGLPADARAECDYPAPHRRDRDRHRPAWAPIKSAMGIGALLLHGIGDTIRVTLTGGPGAARSYAARDILKAAGLRKDGREHRLLPHLRTDPHRPDRSG